MGMGGAGIAGTGDIGAFFTNPAGLGYAEQSVLTGELSTIVAHDDATYRLEQAGPQTRARISRTLPTSLNFLNKVPTRRGSLVFGGGYNQIHSFTRSLQYAGENTQSSITDSFRPYRDEFDIEKEPGPDEMLGTDDDVYIIDWFGALPELAYEAFAIDFDAQMYEEGNNVPFISMVSQLPVTQRAELVEEGRMGEISLGGAVEAFKGGMTGLSLNIVNGSYTYDRVYEEVDDENVSSGSGLSFDRLEYITTLETDLVGINVRGGVSTEVAERLRLGLVLETPTYYSASETYSTEIRTMFDNGEEYAAGGGATDPGTGEFDYSITTPWRIGVGGSVHVGGLRLGGDLTYVDWSQMQLSSEDEDYSGENRYIRGNYSAVWPYRIGAEYEFGPIALRGGYAVRPDARPDERGINRDRLYYTAGLGYRAAPGFSVEASWMRETFEDRVVPYSGVTGTPTVTEDISRNFITLGVKVGF